MDSISVSRGPRGQAPHPCKATDGLLFLFCSMYIFIQIYIFVKCKLLMDDPLISTMLAECTLVTSISGPDL
jgi:hypothetical protein